MKKDILFLCQFFYPEHNSSATLPFDTAKYLASKGYNVGALCGYPKEYSDAGEVPLKEQVEGVDIERLQYAQLKRANTIGRLINYFSFEDAYARFGYENGQFVVSYFGNMGICQDMETLMGAAEILKDDNRVKFLLVGHGNKKDAIRQMIKDNKLINVQELDFLTGKAFEQAVAISSCCVVSLEKGLKGTCAPSKYYSYLQGGQPVLAVVEKGSYLEKEVNREKIGCAVEVGNSKDLADKILFMLNHSDECKEAGERAELLYENMYAYGVAMNRYEDVIKKVVE